MADKILMAHGSGGLMSHDLITSRVAAKLQNEILGTMDDAAVLNCEGRLAFTTDSYVVTPCFFPGGDIGKLAVCGTVNDLSVMGASPRYLSLGLILEEGLPLSELDTIMDSIAAAASEAGVQVVTGDTKVVARGSADKIFINTSGIGLLQPGTRISGSCARPGDVIIINGTIADHGTAVLSQREGLKFSGELCSDCAPLNGLVEAVLDACGDIHAMRDPTRGGLATSLNEIARQSSVGIVINEEAVPVRQPVASLCELLGLDPLYVANEGKLLVFVPASGAEKVVGAMQNQKYGRQARVIGEVTEAGPSRVMMRTRLGTTRIVNMITGDLLPRIC